MPTSSRAVPVVLLGSLSVLTPMAIDIYVPALPVITDDLHTTAGGVQITLASYVVGLALGQLLLGSLSDTWGRRKPMLVSLAFFVATSVACAVAPSMPVLAVVRFLQGLSGAAGMVLARAIARDLYTGARLTRVFAVLSMMNGIAPVVAPLLGGVFLHYFSWPVLFVFLGLVGAVLLIWCLFSLPETLVPTTHSSGIVTRTWGNYRGLLADRGYLTNVATAGLLLVSLFAYLAGAAFVLENGYGLSPTAFSTVFAINAVGMVLGSATASRLTRATHPARILTGAIIALAASGLALAVAGFNGAPLLLLLVPLFVHITALGASLPCCTALAMLGQGNRSGAASALLGVVQFTAGGLITPVIGLGGTVPTAIMTTVMATAALVAAVTLVRTPRR